MLHSCINTIKNFPYKVRLLLLLILCIGFYVCLPQKLFDTPHSTVVLSAEGNLLGAKIASDGQWRFPERSNAPYKYAVAVVQYEDAYFYYHMGINVVSVIKAFWANFKAQKVVRGASTLSQQLVRLSRKGKPRNITEKLIEALLAFRIECSYSKEEILALYSSYAPFGGNVVGVDAAAWRYFGTKADNLSWAEAATLAVLPNAPSLIHLGRNRAKLLHKRNALLQKLYTNGYIDSSTLNLALLEPLPQKPLTLPQGAPHLVNRIVQQYPNGVLYHSSVSSVVQEQLNAVVQKYFRINESLLVHNMAVLLCSTTTGEVLGYVGNTPCDAQYSPWVNMITSPRSTGSTLKPLLYGLSLHEGVLLPEEILPDVPINYSGFQPQNANETYSGAVSATEALQQSLNVPFVELLRRYGYQKFYAKLQSMGFTSVNKGAEHYGLSIILGGAEASLWEIVQAYASMGFALNHYNQQVTPSNKWFKLSTLKASSGLEQSSFEKKKAVEPSLMGAAAIYKTFEAMQGLVRPQEQYNWQYYEASQPIAWKTGTSFGGRDAWAVGVTPAYTVGVWVGNSSGEGRPEIMGSSIAAPVLLEVFRSLPASEPFKAPRGLQSVVVCQVSGQLPSSVCPTKTITTVGQNANHRQCKYHKQVFVTTDEAYRVHKGCQNSSQMKEKVYFTLPPLMQWYYAKANPLYEPLPPLKDNCQNQQADASLVFIYPKEGTVLRQVKNTKGELMPFVAQVAYTSKGKLYWYLNSQLLGSTVSPHSISIIAPKGEHILRCISPNGESATTHIRVITP